MEIGKLKEKKEDEGVDTFADSSKQLAKTLAFPLFNHANEP